jgi:hypothetical protein
MSMFLRSPKPKPSESAVPTWFLGIVERLVITLVTIVQPDQAVTASLGWMGLKLAGGWGSSDDFEWVDGAKPGQNFIRSKRIQSLLASLISMSCAYFGGLLMSAQCHDWWQVRFWS